MKILWLLEKELDQSLSATGRLATIRYLEKRHDLVVAAGFRKEKKFYDDIKSNIVYIDSVAVPVLKKLAFAYKQAEFAERFLSVQPIDVVFLNSTSTYLLKRILACRDRMKFKVVLDIRTLPVDAGIARRSINSFLFFKSIRHAAEHCDGITYITAAMREYCMKRFSLNNHKYEIWCSGVDPSLFKNHENNGDASGPMRMIYHGTVARNRNIDKIIVALAMTRRQLHTTLTVMGGGDGLSLLKKMVAKLELENRVTFLDPVPYYKVPEVISRHDIGILPFQNFEGWNTSSPIKLFEYLSCEKPVIVTRIPAHTDVLESKRFAFWANESSPSAIAEAIKEANEKKKLLRKLGQEGRRFVAERFSWEKQVGKLESFLNTVIGPALTA